LQENPREAAELFLAVFKDALRSANLEREVGKALLERTMAAVEGVIDSGPNHAGHTEHDEAYE
jgi:hypothetical protein